MSVANVLSREEKPETTLSMPLTKFFTVVCMGVC